MRKSGFKLDHWRVLTILGIIYIVLDVIFYIRTRMSQQKPVFTKDLLDNILGGE